MPDPSSPLSPFVEIPRSTWEQLAPTSPLPLTQGDVARLSSLGDPMDLAEVDAVYRPLTTLLQIHAHAARRRREETGRFLDLDGNNTPFVIAIAGSVAVGKSSTARLLRELLSRWGRTPRVDLVTTDGFLLPNAVLDERNILYRKGFPESYDRRALLDFMRAVKSGQEHVEAPLYDHVTYDIVQGKSQTVSRPDILIIEGLNVLQPAREDRFGQLAAVSDYFDVSIYVDANPVDVENWYVSRFKSLQQTAFANPASYFNRYADLTEAQAHDTATAIWKTINLPNLIENVEPTRSRATVILRKGADHRIESVLLRRV